MADKPYPAADDDDRRIADAGLLFGDKTASRPQPEATPTLEVSPGDDYALEERVEPVRKSVEPFFDEAPTGVPVVAPAAPAAATPKESWTREELEPDPRARTQSDDSDEVEQIWSRGAEWGGTLATLAAVVLVTVSIFAWSISAGYNWLAFLSVLAGGAAFILCSYPVLITLERPVRITPEQAVKDFYGALSHHVPHFRRMWLLLSTGGRNSGHFTNFPEFKRHWVDRLAKLHAGRAGRFTPLKFEVGDFKADKSQGKTSVVAKYTVKVWIRGRQGEGPIASHRVETSLVKGSDRMWYLDEGFLPVERT